MGDVDVVFLKAAVLLTILSGLAHSALEWRRHSRLSARIEEALLAFLFGSLKAMVVLAAGFCAFRGLVFVFS